MIAHFFKEIGWVEELGSGVRNAFKYCSLYNIGATPSFTEGDVFKTIIPLKSDDTQKATQKATQKTDLIILDMIKSDPSISRKEIASLLDDITEDGVKYHLDKLKKIGKIKRIGPDRGGYWQIVE